MRVLISELPADFEPDHLIEALEHFAPVAGFSVIRDGNPDRPVVLVKFEGTASTVSNIALRLNDHLLLGHTVKAHVLMHE